MEEYLYPLIVEGNWESEHAKTVKNKLQIYFQSKKKSQGGDCVLQNNDKSNSATMLFKSSDIRDGILSKAEHIITIDNQQIKLKVFKPSDVEKQAGSTGPKVLQRLVALTAFPKVSTTDQSASQTDVDVKKPQETSAVVLENLPDDVKQNVLTLLVENISRLPENDFSIELIPELGKAVVNFKNTNAAEKFLEDSRTHEKLKKKNMRARALERSTSVRVENLPAEANNDTMLLELYFEKWGGPVEEVITIPSEQAAIVTFKEEEAKERVMKQDNKICDVPLKIYPYFKSLDTILYGVNRPHLKLPEPVTVSVHPAIREFILKKGQISSIKDQMSSHFCHIKMDKPDVLLSPDPALLKQKGVTIRRIDDWSKNTTDAFKKIISNYTTSEWPVSHALWSNVESDIRKVVKDQVFTDLDASKGVLTLAGMTHEIIGLKPIMKKFLEGATNQIEREKNSVTEYLEISPAMYSLLEQDGLKSATAVSPHLQIDYNQKMNRLVLSGLHSETLAMKSLVLEKKINMKQKHLQIDHSILEFLKSVEFDEMSRDLFISHGITAVYTIENGDVVVIGSTERALAEAEKRINTVLITKCLIVEDQSVLQMPEWHDLKKQLENSSSTFKKGSVFINLSKKRDKVTVTGFSGQVMEVSENLGCFIEKHSRIEETVCVKSHAAVEFIKDRKSQDWQHLTKSNEVKVCFDLKRPWIKMSGKSTFVQPAVTLFKKLADGLYTDTLIIKKAGVKKFFMEQGKMNLSTLLNEKRFVVVLQKDDMLDEAEDEFTEDIGQVSCEVRMPGGVTVTVRKADICKIIVDAVVNAANEDLNHSGGVALALLQAAGPCLQQYCDRHTKVNGPLKPGDAIITGAGSLPCKYVVHAVGPRFGNSDRHTTVQRLRRAVRESLNQASSKNCSSIAIPVISSGIFGCPLDLCTESVAKEVHEYIEDHKRKGFNSTLTEIHLVDNNGTTVNAMTQAVGKEFVVYNPKMNIPHQAKYHGYSNYRQGYHGHGRENYSQINQQFEGHENFERKPHSTSGGRSDNPEGLSVLETKTTQEGLKIILSKGNIQDACTQPLKKDIYPYFKSLDTILYGVNRPHLKLPEPVTVSVHPAIREFILKKGQISSIKDQMSSHFCHIKMDKPDVLLSPDPALLKQKGVTIRRIDDWSKNTTDAFKKIISNYTTSEWPVSHALWSNVESDIRKVVKDQVFTDLDASKGVLTLAGMTHEIIGLKPIMKKFLEGATNQIEREKNSVTEYLEISPAMYSLLEQDGLKSATAVSPHLQIDYNQKMNRLVLSGLHSETLAMKSLVLEKKINMKQKHLQIDHSILEFLKSVEFDEMSRDLFISHGITAVYTIENGDVVVIGSTERALAEAEKRINTVLITKCLIVEDQSVLQMPEWHDLKKQLENSSSTFKKGSVFINLSKKRDKVTVTGFSGQVMEVSENLGCFIEKHSRIEETVCVKSHAAVEFIKDRKSQDWQHLTKSNEVKVCFDLKRPWIKMSGKSTFVQPAVTLFKKLADGLYTDTLIIKKAGVKKFFMEQGKMNLSTLLNEKRFVVVLQKDDMLDEAEDEFTEDIGQVSCEVRMPGGVTVTVRKADICKIIVDAVVNAANEDLNHSGGVALALLQAAGPCLQQYCDRHTKVNGPLKPGDAIITGAGSLPCKYVVHAVGPRFGNSDRHTTVQRLRRAVRESLNQASSKNCSSIAIPVISSGIFGCPLDLCTESVAKEVHEYIEDHKRKGFNSTLTEIHLVDNNGTTVNAMTQAVGKEFVVYNPKMNIPHQAKYHGYSNYRQGYHGHGRENYSQINQQFEGHENFERKPHSTSGGRSDNPEGLSVLETKTTQEGLKIILSKGNIQDACADIIVNTISDDLDLRKGGVSNALLQTAGHQLQSEITRAARSKNVNFGEMVITDGYKLKCQKVFHVVCPLWKHGSGHKVLIKIIRDCLDEAENWKMASVVFPAIGTGNLSFPKDVVARIMLTEVQEFKPTNLREVTVIVHPSDKESIQCFTSVFRHGIQGQAHRYDLPSGKSPQKYELVGKVSSPYRGVHFMQLDQVTLKVSSGDITKEKTDAIVNSSNHTFSLKTGVSKAILDAAGAQVEQECSKIVGSSNKKTEIVTSAGRLPCKNIIHVIGRSSPSDIKDVVFSVLKLCESRKITSVTLPALGTGQGGANPADIADAMVDAVVDFVKKNKPVHVKFVKFLIFQTNMVEDFHQSMIRRSGEKVEEDRSLFTKIKESPTYEEFVTVREEIEPAVFQLCGETPKDLSKARDKINSMILWEHVTMPIHDPAIAHFTREDGEMLNAMQRELTVSVRLEKKGQDSVITLEGLTKDVHIADSRIQDMIRKVEKNQNRRSDALIISKVIKWQYQESGYSINNFDVLTNYELEQAFQKQQASVRIKINNDEYEADLVLKVATKGKARIKLTRVELQENSTAHSGERYDRKGGTGR